jgi:hypothetical protein
MAFLVWIVSTVGASVWNSLRVLVDICSFVRLCLRSPAAVASENLFLRKQLGLYIEQKKTSASYGLRSLHASPTVPFL